ILARLEAGNPVLVFPEGERCADGQFHTLRPGIALLVSRVKVPILPAGIAGAYEALPRHRKWPSFSPLFLPWSRQSITVVYGRPRDPATLDRLSREKVLEVLHADIAAVVEEAQAKSRGRLLTSARADAS